MILIIPILLLVNVVFGLLWKRGLLPLLAIAFFVALGFGIYLGDWSFIRSTDLARNAIYIIVTTSGYFALVIVPAIAGATLGHLLRKSFNQKRP